MSKLLQAIVDRMHSHQGNARKGKQSEPFSRSELKKLIQQEFAPAKRAPASTRRGTAASDVDTEPMNLQERGSAEHGGY